MPPRHGVVDTESCVRRAEEGMKNDPGFARQLQRALKILGGLSIQASPYAAYARIKPGELLYTTVHVSLVDGRAFASLHLSLNRWLHFRVFPLPWHRWH